METRNIEVDVLIIGGVTGEPLVRAYASPESAFADVTRDTIC